MEYLVYKSRALVAPGSAACRDIVALSQLSNAYLGLTGFLHAEEGLFIQYLTWFGDGRLKPIARRHAFICERTCNNEGCKNAMNCKVGSIKIAWCGVVT